MANGLHQIREVPLTAPLIRALIELSEQWAATEPTYGYIANTEADFIDRRVFVAGSVEAPVGYLLGIEVPADHITSICPDGTRTFDIEELYVCPAFRGQGIGSGLIDVACTTLHREGVALITLTSIHHDQERAFHFYQSQGLTPWTQTFFRRLE